MPPRFLAKGTDCWPLKRWPSRLPAALQSHGRGEAQRSTSRWDSTRWPSKQQSLVEKENRVLVINQALGWKGRTFEGQTLFLVIVFFLWKKTHKQRFSFAFSWFVRGLRGSSVIFGIQPGWYVCTILILAIYINMNIFCHCPYQYCAVLYTIICFTRATQGLPLSLGIFRCQRPLHPRKMDLVCEFDTRPKQKKTCRGNNLMEIVCLNLFKHCSSEWFAKPTMTNKITSRFCPVPYDILVYNYNQLYELSGTIKVMYNKTSKNDSTYPCQSYNSITKLQTSP